MALEQALFSVDSIPQASAQPRQIGAFPDGNLVWCEFSPSLGPAQHAERMASIRLHVPENALAPLHNLAGAAGLDGWSNTP